MAEIFISYKSQRRKAAAHLAKVLECYGYSVWFDYKLIKGDDFRSQIAAQIGEAKAVVVLWCSMSVGSQWVLEEAGWASKQRKLVPVKIEECELPFGFAFSDTVDFTSWEGAPRGYQLDPLLDALEQKIGRAPAPDRKALRDYEDTWRRFGAPTLKAFALSEQPEGGTRGGGLPPPKEPFRFDAQPKAAPQAPEREQKTELWMKTKRSLSQRPWQKGAWVLAGLAAIATVAIALAVSWPSISRFIHVKSARDSEVPSAAPADVAPDTQIEIQRAVKAAFREERERQLQDAAAAKNRTSGAKDRAGPLDHYNAAIGDSSISGFSSGAFMAVQFATAWSSVIRGVGAVAGGPYGCVKADRRDFLDNAAVQLHILNAVGPCMRGPPPDPSVLIAKADALESEGDIDPPQNLARQKVYLFHGYNDAVVAKSVTDSTAEFYRHYQGDLRRGNLYYQTALGAGHALVVQQQAQAMGLNSCPDSTSPYINQCGNYDQVGIILQYIYGALNPPRRGALTGTLKPFDQSLYGLAGAPEMSLGDTGYVFVPKDCENHMPCRVHIALHGCKQDTGDIGRKFIEGAGYNFWADTNRFIVLYPQTQSSFPVPANPKVPVNPEACWDWWGYVDQSDDYVTRFGHQIRAIKAMLDTLTAAAERRPVAAAGRPQGGPAVIDTADTAAALAWTPVPGATSYNVWRATTDGAFTLAGSVAGPSFGDSGLTPDSIYRWRVTAVVSGAEGPPSAVAVASTRPVPAPCNDPGSCP